MKKTPSKPQSEKFLDIASKVQSWNPIERNGWVIKFSIFDDKHILLFFVSTYTGQTIIREFESELDAIRFINRVIEMDPQYGQKI